MGRIIGGVILGYLVMIVLVFGIFTAAWYILGTNGAFQPGSWDASGTWIGMSIVVGLLAAYIGGLVCVKIGGAVAAKWLIGVVLVLGLLMAYPALTATPPTEARPDTIEMADAMMKARTPAWLAILNPFLAVLGVLLAARGKGEPAKPDL